MAQKTCLVTQADDSARGLSRFFVTCHASDRSHQAITRAMAFARSRASLRRLKNS